jgi:hypothetical protein
MPETKGSRNRMPRMLHRLKVLTRVGLVSAVTLLAACSHSAAATDGAAMLRESAKQFVPPDALDEKVAPGIPWVQIDFDVRREPLQFAFSEGLLRRATADGWAICHPNTSEWNAYEDRSVRPTQYIQSLKYGLYRKGILIVLIGLYYSENEASSVKKHEGQSEEPTQHGVVIARNSTRHEALEWAASQALSCDNLAEENAP